MKKMTFAEIRSNFWESLPEELRKERRTRKTQNDYCTDIRCAFVEYVDVLLKNGEITEKQADNITL